MTATHHSFSYRFHHTTQGTRHVVSPGVSASSTYGTVVEASGVVRERILSVPNLPRMHVDGALTAALVVDPDLRDEVMLRVVADDNVLPLVSARARAGQVRLTLAPGTYHDLTELSVRATVGPLIEVTAADSALVSVRGLQAPSVTLATSGSARLTAEGGAREWMLVASAASRLGLSAGRARRVLIDAAQAAEVQLSGRADEVELSVSGTARVRADGPQFEAERARVALFGASVTHLRARQAIAGRLRFPAQLRGRCDGRVDVDGLDRRR